MYNSAMMDPELIKLAQEQMSRMSPTDFAKIQEQMMANPELMRMASETMMNMRPEDLRTAAEQLKYTRPDEMTEIGEKMANSTPEEIAAMRAHANSAVAYQINAAEMLKKQGNELHGKGMFNEASQKYLLAKKNLTGIPSSKGRTLLLACSLNLMSCYLKTKQYDECIQEGTEVLAYDAINVKALYRRGQAYKELGLLKNAVADLNKAHEVSPDDETIGEVLRDAKEKVTKQGGEPLQRKLMIEEITEVETGSTGTGKSSGMESPVTQSQETSGCSESQTGVKNEGPASNSECLQTLKDDPEAIRSFQNFISNADPNTLAALNAGKAGEFSPDMIKTASNMISKMSPEELRRMVEMASSFQGENPYFSRGSLDSDFSSFRPGSVPQNVTPEMLKTATEMMNKMSAEERKKMFEMASSLRVRDSVPNTASLNTNGLSSEFPQARESSAVNENNDIGESSSHGSFSNLRSASQSTFPASTAEMQEQMRNQMKDPNVRQMFTSMIKNMSPEMMANMGEQFGVKLSREDAEKAQQALSSLSPENLDRMMRWADGIQRGAERARKTKKWLLGKPGMILAICMLVLAMILHRLGYIGS